MNKKELETITELTNSVYVGVEMRLDPIANAQLLEELKKNLATLKSFIKEAK